MNIIKKILLATSLITGVGITTTNLVSCGHHSNSSSWSQFKSSAELETPNSLKSLISDQKLETLGWDASDVAIFDDNGAPHQFKDNQEIVAIICIKGQDPANQKPIDFNISYTGAKYQKSNWENSLEEWTDFKEQAESESPDNLKALLTTTELLNYHWNSGDTPEFSKKNPAPIVRGHSQIIIATIVVNGYSTGMAYPIVFQIKFKYQEYNVYHWTNSSGPGIDDWNAFKQDVKNSDMSTTTLLELAKKELYWRNFIWHNETGPIKWTDSDKPEWDVYGAASGGNDPYPGMNGQITYDDTNYTITAIISIIGKDGLSSACPIKCVISDIDDIKYDKYDWVFTNVTQKQSAMKYSEIAKADLGKATSMSVAKDWNNFILTHWTIPPKQPTTVKSQSFATLLSSAGLNDIDTRNVRHISPTKFDLNSGIIMTLSGSSQHKGDYDFILSAPIPWVDNSKTVTSAYNYTFNIELKHLS